MLIFIPVLIICFNSQCEFQQADSYYTKESECRQQVDLQTATLRSLLAEVQPPVVIEGTCITARVRWLSA